jgi:hypothetical protein
MNIRHSRLAALVVLGFLRFGCALPGQDGSPLSIGTLRRMHSEILKEDRTLSIRVPPDYERTQLSYPVIYLLYGDQTEGYYAETVFALERLEGGAEIPECIVVGIHNTDRYGNLLPVHFAGRPAGADSFMEFLEKELFPFIESKYRTKPYRLLIGPQAGGPFGLYALACRPALFNVLILENPFSAPASRDLLQTKLREYAAERPLTRTSVYINSFDRTGFQDHSEANKAMNEALDAFEPTRPAGLRIWRRHLDEPTFVPSLELKQPLRTIFAGFYPPEARAMAGLAEVIAYYREMGGRLGFGVDPPAFLLAAKSDDLSRAGRTTAAREILEYALSLRPCDTNALPKAAGPQSGSLFRRAAGSDRAHARGLGCVRLVRGPEERAGGSGSQIGRPGEEQGPTDLFRRTGVQRSGLSAARPGPGRPGRLRLRVECPSLSRFLECARQPG